MLFVIPEKTETWFLVSSNHMNRSNPEPFTKRSVLDSESVNLSWLIVSFFGGVESYTVQSFWEHDWIKSDYFIKQYWFCSLLTTYLIIVDPESVYYCRTHTNPNPNPKNSCFFATMI